MRRLIRLRDVIEATGLSRSCIYKYINEGKFPRSVTVGGRSVRWVESEVQDWIQSAIANRDSRINQ